MFGWMYRARNKDFQLISDQLDPDVLREVLSGLAKGKVDPNSSVPDYGWSKYQSHLVDNGLLRFDVRNVLVYKTNPNAFMSVPNTTWVKLRDVRDRMKAKMLGPADPPLAELCARPPPPKPSQK